MKKLVKKWKLTSLLLFLILIFGLVLRLYNLTILPVFADEAIYIRWSQIMSAEPTLRFLPLSDGKQPLFMWILMFVVKRISDPLFAGRMLSVLSGLGTMIGLFLLTFYLFKSKKAALVSTLAWAISPFSLFFDRMALVDSLLTMFSVWTIFLGIISTETLRFDMAILAGFSLGFAYLTKSPALFFAMLLPVMWIFVKNKNQIIKTILLSLTTFLISQAMYNILRLGPNFQMVALRNQDYVFPISHFWTNPKDPLISHIGQIRDWINRLGPGTLLILAPAGFILNFKKHKKVVIFLAVWFLFPILVQSEFAKVFTARYILFTIAPLIILAASFFNRDFKNNFIKLLTIVCVYFVLESLVIDWKILASPQIVPFPESERSGYLEEWTAGTGIKEVADYIRTQVADLPAGRQVIIGTEGFFGTLPDGLQMYVEKVPRVVVKGVGVTISDVHPSLIDSKKAGNKTYLVVNSTRFKGDPLKLGLNLIAQYPKAVRIDGSRESLLFFEVTDKSITSLEKI